MYQIFTVAFMSPGKELRIIFAFYLIEISLKNRDRLV